MDSNHRSLGYEPSGDGLSPNPHQPVGPRIEYAGSSLGCGVGVEPTQVGSTTRGTTTMLPTHDFLLHRTILLLVRAVTNPPRVPTKDRVRILRFLFPSSTLIAYKVTIRDVLQIEE